MSVRRRICGALVAFALLPSVARAEDGSAVALGFQGCPETTAATIERIALLELHASASARPNPTRVSLECAGDRLTIVVDDPLTAKRVERIVSTAEAPEVTRPRLVALAIAELVRASWIELETTPTPALPAAAPVVAAEDERERARAIAAPPPRRRGLHAYLALSGELPPALGELLLGGSLSGQYGFDVGPSTAFVELALSAFAGSARRPSGDVSISSYGVEPRIGAFIGSRLQLWAGLRGAAQRLGGQPGSSSFIGGVSSGFGVAPTLGARVSPVKLVWLTADLGYWLRGVRGTAAPGEDDIALSGPFVSLGLAFGG